MIVKVTSTLIQHVTNLGGNILGGMVSGRAERALERAERASEGD